jgi:hypothetical protein
MKVKLHFHYITEYKIIDEIINGELRNDSKTGCVWPSETLETTIHIK